MQDLRYAARQLRANPGFAAVAVLSLGLGVGANNAIFQLVDAVRLRTLPVANPWELVIIDFAKGSSRAGNWSTRSARLTLFNCGTPGFRSLATSHSPPLHPHGAAAFT